MNFLLPAAHRSGMPAGDAIIILCFQDNDRAIERLPAPFNQTIRSLIRNRSYVAKADKKLFATLPHRQRLIDTHVYGLGRQSEPDDFRWLKAGVAIGSLSREKKYKSVSVLLPEAGNPAGPGANDRDRSLQHLGRGLMLGNYRFSKYQSKKPAPPSRYFFHGDGRIPAGPGAMSADLARAETVSVIINRVRDLINEPPSVLNPDRFVSEIRRLGRRYPFTLKVLSKPALKKIGCAGILAVSAGSSRPPYIVRLEYRNRRARETIHLVGKGLTFDSGGLSLKPPQSMETMKCDMSGAGAVLGVLMAASRLRLPVHLVGYLAICENLPDADSYKPGDILVMANKKTVEVLNTDAEGRLVLADALLLCEKEKAKTIIDLATLTGSCMVGLGHHYAGVFSTDEKLREQIVAAGRRAGERLWPLPLDKAYKTEMDSSIADIKNIGSKYGGAIHGALFLREFVKQAAWAHIDIAGPAFYDSTPSPEGLKNATGFGIATVLEFLNRQSKS